MPRAISGRTAASRRPGAPARPRAPRPARREVVERLRVAADAQHVLCLGEFEHRSPASWFMTFSSRTWAWSRARRSQASQVEAPPAPGAPCRRRWPPPATSGGLFSSYFRNQSCSAQLRHVVAASGPIAGGGRRAAKAGWPLGAGAQRPGPTDQGVEDPTPVASGRARCICQRAAGPAPGSTTRGRASAPVMDRCRRRTAHRRNCRRRTKPRTPPPAPTAASSPVGRSPGSRRSAATGRNSCG